MIRVRPASYLLMTCALTSALAVVPAQSSLAKKDALVTTHIAYRQWDSAAGLSEATPAGTVVTARGLEIGSPVGTFTYTDPFPAGSGRTATYDVATWTSPELTPGFNYTELVASWNADTPAGTWVQVAVTGLGDDGVRSKSYILGRWAAETPEHAADPTIHRTSVPAQGDDLATVAIDTLVARSGRSLSTWQLTVSLFRETGTTATPSVSMIGAFASVVPAQKKIPASPTTMTEQIDLAVPPYSQETHIGQYPEYNNGGEAWCSPTSTAMILGYWGRGPTADDYAWVDPSYADPWVDYAAANTYDWNYDGTGNWPFNTAYAARYDLEGFVTRLRSLTEAEQFIKAGIPLVVSVSFKKNELTGAGYGTNGHLMVIRGFDANGNVIANDPASQLIPNNDTVRRVYDRAEFENVWVHSGRIVYVIHPAAVPLPAPANPAEPNW